MNAPSPSREQRASHANALFVVDEPFLRPMVADFSSRNPAVLRAMAALNRCNAITCCKAAEHGWPGASLSCLEILMELHARAEIGRVVLAKGHAAAAQYAVLLSRNQVSAEQLVAYKDGSRPSGHLEAHADIFADTGSLGQALSTAVGLAAGDAVSVEGPPTKKIVAVVLGDGELQEGQNYEALMTLANLPPDVRQRVLVVVDRNGFQSDNRCDVMKSIPDLASAFRGIAGFDTLCVNNGNDCVEVSAAIDHFLRHPHTVIVCDTVKGHGTSLMAPEVHPVTGREWQPWHTRIFNWEAYRRFIDEQLGVAASQVESESVPEDVKSSVNQVMALWAAHRSARLSDEAIRSLPNTHRPTFSKACIGTGAAFGEHLVKQHFFKSDSRVAIVSADLASSCNINEAVGHARFYEVGIAEQDAASFAAGLALAGKPPRQLKLGLEHHDNHRHAHGTVSPLIPVVCTYSNFLKRCFENIFINVVHGVACIYAGHYSGLCYHTDGKSHQSINDTSCFVAMPGMVCVDPLTADHARKALDVAFQSLANDRQQASHSYYFRLRRTPNVLVESAAAPFDLASQPLAPIELRAPERGESYQFLFIVMGPVAAETALRCAAAAWGSSSRIVVVPALCNASPAHPPVPSQAEWDDVFSRMPTHAIVVIEDDAGALHGAACRAFVTSSWLRSAPSSSIPPVLHRNVSHAAPSFRTLDDALEYFRFTPEAIFEELQKMLHPSLC